mmetsp:Transcript_30033/g.39513  ORF Transcript_30033/g.39513 Transcript_30033/m.39513 type:complete len:465 (+) Transcript_30033:26-1420(+)
METKPDDTKGNAPSFEYLALVLGGLDEFVSQKIREELSGDNSVCNIQVISPAPGNFPNTQDGVRLGNAGVGQLILQTNAAPSKVLGLRCVQAVYGLVLVEPQLYISDLSAKDGGASPQVLDRFEQLLLESSRWDQALDLWQKCMVFHGKEDSPAKRASGNLTFRGSAVRDGKHGFKSPDLAGTIGAAVGQRFSSWKVNLSEYDVEVVTLMWQTHAVVGLSLDPFGGPTKSKLAPEKRAPMNQFGRNTTLRPSTAHVLTLLAEVQPGDVVLDTMCGVGTIPVEVAVMHPSAYSLGGEIEMKCVPEIQSNLRSFAQHPTWARRIGGDGCLWDASNLPLRDHTIDCIIVDMPFGVACGSTKKNKKMYPRIFKNFARILRPNGRAVLLVYQSKLVLSLIDNGLWHKKVLYPVNIGGLVVTVFVLQRTQVPLADVYKNFVKKSKKSFSHSKDCTKVEKIKAPLIKKPKT